MQKFTLHTHTIGFDGKNTVLEMVSSARAAGFDTLGVSNHFIVHPKIKQSRMYPYAVRGGYSAIYSDSFDEVMDKFRAHYTELRQLQSESNIRILCGAEVDFFPTRAWRDGFLRAVDELSPDYLIGSAHFVYYDGNLCNVHDIANVDADVRDEILGIYWDNVAVAATSGLFNFMAHIDLPKKVGIGRTDKWCAAENRALDAIADSGTAMEINTGLYRPEIYEPYPSARILRAATARNIPVLLSDDAHAANQIGRHFDDARQFAHDCGVNNFITLQNLLDFPRKSR